MNKKSQANILPVFLIFLIFAGILVILIPLIFAETELFYEDFEAGNFNSWTLSGDAFTIATDRAIGTNSAKCRGPDDCIMELATPLDTFNASGINVTFQFNDDDLDATDVDISFNDSSGTWQLISFINSASEDTWLNFTVSATNSTYFHSRFNIRFSTNLGGGPGAENLWLDNINVSISNPYGWLNVSIEFPTDGSNFSQYDTNLTINATVTCEGDTGATCGIVSALARYNVSSGSPDIDINVTEGELPFYVISGGGWDLSTATYDNVNISTQGVFTEDLFFKSDGTKLYELGSGGVNLIYQYSCSDAWNLSSCSYDNVNISTQGSNPRGLFLNSPGTRLYQLGFGPNLIYQYSCSDAWNLSSCSYDNINIGAQGQPMDLFFKSDGTRLYHIGDATNKFFYQYSCSDAWNLSSCSYDNINIGTQGGEPEDLFFKSDGTRLYEIGDAGNLIYQYSCSDAWNLSSCSYDNVNISTQGIQSGGLFFKSDGTKLYETGYNDLTFQSSVLGIENPQSINLLQGESWNVSWTLNITTASTESYLIDVLFNSSHGNSNVPNNDTANRQVNLNPSVTSTTFIVNSRFPINWTNTTDTTPTFEFNSTGTASSYSCELLLNSTGYGVDASTLNATNTNITSNASLNGIYNWNIDCTANSITNSSLIRVINVSVADSCTYSSGNWIVDCSDNCNISSNVDIGGNGIYITGTGTFVTQANITGYSLLHIAGTDTSNMCTVTCLYGGCFGP